MPSSTSITHLPRSTGEVRSATEVSVRMLPWPSRPRRYAGSVHAAELVAGDVRNAVVPGEALVDEGVVGGQQVEDAAVLAHDAVEEQLGLAPHRLARACRRTADRAASPGWILSRSCSRSHCAANRVDSASDRRSASIRRTCFSRPAGVRSVPRVGGLAAARRPGTVPQRKNDSRDARSRSLMR